MMNAAIAGDDYYNVGVDDIEIGDDDNDDDDGDDGEDNSDLLFVSNCMLNHEVMEGRVSLWFPDSTTIVLLGKHFITIIF